MDIMPGADMTDETETNYDPSVLTTDPGDLYQLSDDEDVEKEPVLDFKGEKLEEVIEVNYVNEGSPNETDGISQGKDEVFEPYIQSPSDQVSKTEVTQFEVEHDEDDGDESEDLVPPNVIHVSNENEKLEDEDLWPAAEAIPEDDDGENLKRLYDLSSSDESDNDSFEKGNETLSKPKSLRLKSAASMIINANRLGLQKKRPTERRRSSVRIVSKLQSPRSTLAGERSESDSDSEG
jgi:hypothetical protein